MRQQKLPTDTGSLKLSRTGVSHSVYPALSVDTQDNIGEDPGPIFLALRLLEFVLWSVVAKRVIPALRRQKQED